MQMHVEVAAAVAAVGTNPHGLVRFGFDLGGTVYSLGSKGLTAKEMFNRFPPLPGVIEELGTLNEKLKGELIPVSRQLPGRTDVVKTWLRRTNLFKRIGTRYPMVECTAFNHKGAIYHAIGLRGIIDDDIDVHTSIIRSAPGPMVMENDDGALIIAHPDGERRTITTTELPIHRLVAYGHDLPLYPPKNAYPAECIFAQNWRQVGARLRRYWP